MPFYKQPRFLECLLIFGVMPPVAALLKPHGWMHAMLWVGSLVAWRWLAYHGHHFRKDWNWRAFEKLLLREMLRRFMPLALVLCAFTFLAIPDRLFSLPLEHPQTWVMVMLLYPLLSVIPQEIIFRSFFFRRYSALFSSPRAMILASALAFGWVHILLLNSVAVIFSFCGGLIFASSYHKTRSLAVACAEHALYGCLIFTLGLGYYFYHGQAVH